MMAIERAANACIELCDLIEDRSLKLDARIKALLTFIHDGTDHQYHGCLDNVADSLERRVAEIWALVKDRDRDEQPELGRLYAEIHRELLRHYDDPASTDFRRYYGGLHEMFCHDEDGRYHRNLNFGVGDEEEN
jgi:hypothetical protein